MSSRADKRSWVRDWSVDMYLAAVDLQRAGEHRDNYQHRDEALEMLLLFGQFRQDPHEVVDMLDLLGGKGETADVELVLEGVLLGRDSIESVRIIAEFLDRVSPYQRDHQASLVAQLITSRPMPRMAAHVLGALDEESSPIVEEVLDGAALRWRIPDLVRLQLALFASGYASLAESSVDRTVKHRTKVEEISDLLACRNAYRMGEITEDDPILEHVRTSMPVDQLAGLLRTEHDAILGAVLANVVEQREIRDVVRLQHELDEHQATTFSARVPVLVAEKRGPKEIVDYLKMCEEQGRNVAADLFTKLGMERSGETIAHVMLQLREAHAATSVDLVATKADAPRVETIGARLSDYNNPRLAVRVLRTALHGQPERFTPDEIARLLGQVCRHHPALWRLERFREDPSGTAYKLVKVLNQKLAEHGNGDSTGHFAALADAVDREVSVTKEVRDAVVDGIKGAVRRFPDHEIRRRYVAALRHVGNDDIAEDARSAFDL